MTYFTCLLLFRYCLPLCILITAIIRPSLLSALYCVPLFITPLLQVPTPTTMKGATGTFLKVLLGVAIIGTLLQGGFHMVLALQAEGYDEALKVCTEKEMILRNLGFVTFGNNILVQTALVRIAPETLILTTGIGFFVLFRRLTSKTDVHHVIEGVESVSIMDLEADRTHTKYAAVFLHIGRHLVLALLCIAAISLPSIMGGVYFLIFLGTATCWACCKPLQRGFGIFLCALAPLILINIFILYFFQSEFAQRVVNPDSIEARLIGVIVLAETGCRGENFTGDPRVIHYNAPWPNYIHAIALFLLFHIMVLLGRELLLPEHNIKHGKFTRLDENLVRKATVKKKWQSATQKVREMLREKESKSAEGSPLIRGVSPSKRYGSVKKSTLSGKDSEDVPMDELSAVEDEYKPSIVDNILYIILAMINTVMTVSYLGTNIIMMAWSITFTCWLSFILLIWANLIWLVPHQRKAMLRSSPYLITYISCILIASYILSLNLTEDELPSKFEGVNMKEIGLERENFKTMAIKCIFTIMFFVTLRQYMQEKMVAKHKSALADMVAPLQVTVGAATTGTEAERSQGVKIMDKVGQVLVDFLTKFWIWVVAGTLFAVAITGHRMTGFRIIYMALFLIFLLTFQLSFKIWRKIMFGFWLIVILFSMIVLVATYTYQFDNFSSYWSDYLHIEKEQQLDIGLQVYETKQLFVRLFTPTSFVIITVIQLHYFHKQFMKLSDPNAVGEKLDDDDEEDMNKSSLQGGAYSDKSAKDDTTTESGKFSLSELKDYKHRKSIENLLRVYNRFKNKFFIFLEIHMLKVVLFFAMLCCLNDKCAFYIPVIVLMALSFVIGRTLQLFTIYFTSVLMSLLLLVRMLFQIKYITPENWRVNCTVHKGNETVIESRNDNVWLGLEKVDNLVDDVKWNIIYLVVVTMYSVVKVRQYYYRLARGKPTRRAFFMFPNIKRADAEKDLQSMLKYLANYGFYKFGVELSLITIVVYISIRMDAYALLQALWLLLLFFLKRHQLSKVWIFYLIFTCLTLPIQYLMAVRLPPSLCIEYPWDQSNILLRLADWAYLMDERQPVPPMKLMYDFLLLLVISRQWVVFRIEKRYAGKNYAGGHNDSIIHLADRGDFENPVPDFVTYVRSYLDIAKRVVLLSWFWITLALGFLAGTNRVNIFSMGYLMGSFYFLWQGTDIYLRPIHRIIKLWNYFMFYNVFVIFVKTAFQIIGCVCVSEVQENACWAMSLFGVGCVRKFVDPDLKEDLGYQGVCEVKSEYLGLYWDVLCFAFMILQRRLFNSFNFLRIIDDTKAGAILASRGAELMEEMRKKRMKEQMKTEQNVLKKIKLKMDRIKATQQRMQAIRSGDYYMFEDMEIDEIDILPEQTERDEDKPQSDIPTLGEFVHDTVQSDIDTVVRQRKRSWKRRKTMPLTRSKTTKSTMSAPPTGGAPATKSSTPRSVTIKESDIKPGTSQDEDDDDDLSDISETEIADKKESVWAKIWKYCIFLYAFIESGMLSLTNFLSKYTRDYRYVMKVLSQEKKILKEKTLYNVGKRVGSQQIWQPSGSYHELLGSASTAKQKSAQVPEDEEMSQYDQPVFLRLLLAHWYLILRHSEVLCYFIIFLNQAQTATFLSVPLPIMVFFWGTLTIPRPSKTFWVTIIAYTEVTVLIKCLFQLDIVPWNDDISINNPFFPPKVIGIERNADYAIYDLILLLVVFFHRMLLKSMGIWTTMNPPGPYLKSGDYNLVDGQMVPVPQEDDRPKTTLQALLEKQRRQSTVRGSVASRPSSRANDQTVLSVKSVEVEPCNYFAHSIRLSAAKYAEAFKYFTQQLLDPTSRVVADVYTFMFLCDFTNFFVLIFGFSSFGGQQYGDVTTFVKENKIPQLFLFMLMLQFFLIIVDRGIYLRKNIIGKIIFQIIQVLFLHIWLFILFPILTEKTFTQEVPPQVFYIIKCFYFLLSAYQIRCGYPTRTLGNFLCKGFGLLNMIGYKAYILCPFVFELRAIMDWMWTETSMGVFDWLKMEDIFAHIFQIKCTRQLEEDYPQERGSKKSYLVKYLMGGLLLLFIVLIIWLPLILFSMLGSVGVSNVPIDVSLELRIGQYPPIYHMSAQGNVLYQFTEADYSKLVHVFNKQKKAVEVLSYYTAEDTQAAQLSIDSSSLWLISPPDRQKMVDEVNSSRPLTIRLDFRVSKKANEGDAKELNNYREFTFPPSTKDNPHENRDNLLKMLTSTNTSNIEGVNVPFLLPKFLKVNNQGDLESAGPFMQKFATNDDDEMEYRNVTLSLLKTEGPAILEWWRVSDNCSSSSDKNYKYYLDHVPYSHCEKLVIYTFSDRIFPDTLSVITGGGITGFYGIYFFVIVEVMREVLRKQVFELWLDEIADATKFHSLCIYVYYSRELHQFEAEQTFYEILMFGLRSTELVVKLSRDKGDPYDPPLTGHGYKPKKRKREKLD